MSSRKRDELLKIWYGCDFEAWTSLLRRGRLRISLNRFPLVAAGTLMSAVNSTLGAIQDSLYHERIARAEIADPPIFVLGHWRSGTTLLHELLMCDERHVTPTTYQCMSPHHFLLTERFVPRLLEPLLPRKRPMDQMELRWSSPQEDEFALCNMGLPSPYTFFLFPREAERWLKLALLEGLSAVEQKRWKSLLVRFLKQVTLKTGKRIVLKSPPHTFRARFIREFFPGARFIHIVRNPFAVFPSTLYMFRSLARIHSLQTFSDASFREPVFTNFTRMYEKFKKDRKQIPTENLFELRYEDLIADPLGEMEKIYEHLRLGEFDAVRPKIEGSLRRRKAYQTNRYEISSPLRREISERWAEFIKDYGYQESGKEGGE